MFTLILSGYVVCSQENPYFKDEEKIVSVLKDYFISVDKKDFESMLRYVTIPLNIHFDTEKVVTVESNQDFKILFDNWKKSSKSKFHSTKITSIKVEPTWIVDDLLAVADVTYDRVDNKGKTIRTERTLYHFIRGSGYYSSPLKFMWTFFTRWMSKWKIYMISNIEVDN